MKWLQGLRLSQQTGKNVRREFSNGYLVAEILSLYEPQDFLLNAFGQETALDKKIVNWNMLKQIFAKRSMSMIPAKLIDATIHCKPGAAECLVQLVYSFLTNTRYVCHWGASTPSLAPPPTPPPPYPHTPTVALCSAAVRTLRETGTLTLRILPPCLCCRLHQPVHYLARTVRVHRRGISSGTPGSRAGNHVHGQLSECVGCQFFANR